jgi:hypothetical protein
MTPYEAILTLLIRLAFRDGQLSPVERAYLDNLADAWGLLDRFDALCAAAPSFSLGDVLQAVQHYPDRFWITLRAYLLSQADDDYDARELLSINELMIRLGIKTQDRMLIEQVHPDMSLAEICHLDPRLAQLASESSLADPTTWP